MSTRELQQFIFQEGLFFFSDGKQDQGMVVSRYNIPEAKVEYYFIPAGHVLAYNSARSQHDLNAHRKLGFLVDANSITSAKLLD